MLPDDQMKTPSTRLAPCLAAIAALAVAPATALAAKGEVVPPSNSAAAQYTETFPTTGGDKKTDQGSKHSPAKVLGSKNAKKLQKQGPEGQAAAEAAAATAPAPVEAAPTAAAPPPQKEDTGDGQGHKGGGQSGKTGGGSRAQKKGGNASNGGKAIDAATPQPAGSSGVGSALEQATGLSTSGQSGMLLPLVVLATILASIAYLWRQRRQVD
jgi:hypothetical protein